MNRLRAAPWLTRGARRCYFQAPRRNIAAAGEAAPERNGTMAQTTIAESFLVENLLKEISDVVRTIDDAQSVMAHVVHLTTRLLEVGTCSLMLLDPGRQALRIRAAHGLPEHVLDTWEGKVGDGISGHVAQTGEPLLIEDVETHPLFARKSQKKYSTKSLLSVPMKYEDETIGVLNVNNRLDGRIFTHADELLLCTLANFVVIAIQKARMQERIRENERFEADIRAAREVQEAMLPKELPTLEKWEIAAGYLPAREVAGDFYDAIELPDNRLCVVVGDVCGKGLPAAVYMARVLGYFRVGAHVYNRDAAELMSFVNDLLAPEWTERTFVTAICAIFDNNTGAVSICTAGHQDPLGANIHNRDVGDTPAGNGLPLGVMGGFAFDAACLDTSPGDTFLLYTDGVTEAKDAAGNLFGSDRLKRVMAEHDGTASELAEHIKTAVHDFAKGTAQSDDVTLAVIRRT